MFLARLAEQGKASGWLHEFGEWLKSSAQLSRLFSLHTTEAKCFYLVGGTASLSIYAVAITAYFMSAIEPPNWYRRAFLLLMLIIVALGLAACCLFVADLIREILHAAKQDIKPDGPRPINWWIAIPILVGVTLCWSLAVKLIVIWLHLDWGDQVITGFRAVNLKNGLSPLLPLLFTALAAILWVFCSLRRICLLRETLPAPSVTFNTSQPSPEVPESKTLAVPACPTDQSPQDQNMPDFFYSDSFSFRGLRTLEKGLRSLLACPTLLSSSDSRLPMALTFLLTFFWGGYLFFYRLVYGFEARVFYGLLGVTFLLVAAGVLSNVLRVYLVWRKLRAVLLRLGRLPMREAFTRFRLHNRTLPRMTLAAAPSSLTALGVSIAAACDLMVDGSRFRNKLPNDHALNLIVDRGKDLVQEAKEHYQKALESEANSNRETCIEEQRKAQGFLNLFTRLVESLLEMSWCTTVAEADGTEEIEKARKELEAQSEEFLVSRTVQFLAHMFPQLTNLASYSLGCLFLMLLAISSYPLQPKNPFNYFSWFIIFAFVGVVLNMAVQMNRDGVLSCLNGTRPGEIHWDAEFVGRIVFLVFIPILGVLGVQFPDTIGQILRWVLPAGSGHM